LDAWIERLRFQQEANAGFFMQAKASRVPSVLVKSENGLVTTNHKVAGATAAKEGVRERCNLSQRLGCIESANSVSVAVFHAWLALSGIYNLKSAAVFVQ